MIDEVKKPKLEVVGEDAEKISIPKPGVPDLSKYKSTRPSAIAGVETMLGQLPHHKIADARDFVRLHPHEPTHWSCEFCFVGVPIKGVKKDTLHLVSEDLAARFLSNARVERFRLALATKPFDVFFLCQVPSQNTNNSWNASNLRACMLARTEWVQVTSRKGEGVDDYKIDFARDQDAFPPPKWPTQTLDELVAVTFAGRMIDTDNHPALLRLIGAKQALA